MQTRGYKDSPGRHQLQATRAVLKAFGKGVSRAKCIMACGSGKTYVALLVAERGKYRTIVVLVPSLALVRQVLAEFRKRSTWRRWEAIAVCSDSSVSGDETYVSPDDVGCDVTTDADVVAEFCAEKEGVRVVFCTYNSSHLLQDRQFDLAIFDEAHRTAGRQKKQFGFALSDENVQIDRRLFLTATPKRVTVNDDSEELVFSMADEAVYGPEVYRLDFRKAVDLGLICDLEIVICAVREDIRIDGKRAAQVALKKAMKQFGCKRAFTFHNSIERAKDFAVDTGGFGGISTWHVNGGMSSSERDQYLQEMKTRGGLVTNVRCLGEGVDVPVVDMVAFMDPKRSTIDIVQTAGRAARRSDGKKRGIIFVPIYVPEGANADEMIANSDFSQVFDVVEAMREQDSRLEANLSIAAEALATGEVRDVEGITVVGAEESLEVLDRAITVRMLKTASGINQADVKKQILLEMGRRGEKRPSSGTTGLGRALINYTIDSLKTYDPVFDREIRRVAPHWFINTADENKKKLLDMACRGEPKPKHPSKIAGVLSTYIKSKDSYDPVFDRKIHRLAPHWFIKTSDENKKKLLDMARRKDPRPSSKKQIGSALMTYTTAARSTYDPVFDRKIRSAAPQWFINIADENRKKLLELARRRKPRPNTNTGLGQALRRLVLNASNAHLVRELRSLSPHWFKKTAR